MSILIRATVECEGTTWVDDPEELSFVEGFEFSQLVREQLEDGTIELDDVYRVDVTHLEIVRDESGKVRTYESLERECEESQKIIDSLRDELVRAAQREEGLRREVEKKIAG